MVRLTVGRSGELLPESGRERGRRFGRGTWLCASPECVEAAVKRGQWSRALRCAVAGPRSTELGAAVAEIVRSEARAALRRAWRQGTAAVGARGAARSLGQGSAALVVLATDAASAVRARLEREAGRRGVAVVSCGDRAALGAIGPGGSASAVGLTAGAAEVIELCRRAEALDTVKEVPAGSGRPRAPRGRRRGARAHKR